MKALKLFSPFNFQIVKLNDPEIKEDEILVRVKSVGICRSDCHYYHHGKIGDISMNEPIILGHEFAGEVARIGSRIHQFKINDRVAVDPALSCGACEFCKEGNPNLCPDVRFCGTPPNDGALSEYYVAKEEQLFLIPDEISFDEGAMLEPLGVAIHSFNLANPKLNPKVAIIGCGSIGLLILQLLKNHTSNLILCTDPLDYRLRIARKIGADLTLNPSFNPLEYQQNINNNSNNFDIVFEVSGDHTIFHDAVRLLKPGGKLIVVGIYDRNDISLDSNQSRRKGLTIKFVRRMKNTYPTAIDLILRKKVSFDCIKTHNFKLDDTSEAFSIVDAYKNNVIKAIINP